MEVLRVKEHFRRLIAKASHLEGAHESRDLSSRVALCTLQTIVVEREDLLGAWLHVLRTNHTFDTINHLLLDPLHTFLVLADFSRGPVFNTLQLLAVTHVLV